MSSASREQLLADALAHLRAGRTEPADAIARQLVADDPNDAEALHLLGLVAHRRQDESAAERAILAAIASNPHQPVFHNNLGEIYVAMDRSTDAAASFRRAIELRPGYPRAINNLGNVFGREGNLEEAGRMYEAALRVDPTHAPSRCNLAKLLMDHGHFHAAEAHYRAVLAHAPDYARALDGLAQALAGQRRHRELIETFRRAIAFDPSPVYHSNLLLHLHYTQDESPGRIAAEHRAWAARHANVAQTNHAEHNRDPNRRLRVALLSPDLHAHPVGRFILPLLRHHDRDEIEIVCFADTRRPDALTAELRALADGWMDSARLSDDNLAQQIRAERIDIAIDLAGHSAYNRLRALATKPAPIQATYLGYPNTTGVSAIDYRITDALADPPGEDDSRYVEQPLRLPKCAWCWEPPRDAPDVAPLPALKQSAITFGSFNNVKKTSAATLDLWSAALVATPNSRLLIKAAGFSEPAARQKLLDDFATRGVDASRIELQEQLIDYTAHLAAYARVDIALDTFPYHGTTTTCEALWMGVPVITLAGNAHVSRVGVSLLTNAGLPHLVAHSVTDFREIAATLAANRSELAALRSSLRAQLSRSPLCNAGGFARDFAKLLRTAWLGDITSQ